jgi:hypothetical protein
VPSPVGVGEINLGDVVSDDVVPARGVSNIEAPGVERFYAYPANAERWWTRTIGRCYRLVRYHRPLIRGQLVGTTRSGFNALAILAVSLALIGCRGLAPKHEYVLTPGSAHHAGIASAMVVPINETADVPVGLEIADRRIEEALDDYLRSKGISVERPEIRAYRRAARRATKRARSESMSGQSGRVSEDVSYEDIVPMILDELGVDADIVIVPNLVIRNGEAKGGRSYQWDGVRRYETGNVRILMTGNFAVASFFVVAHGQDGSRVFSGYGGLDTIFEVSLRRQNMSIREDLFQNEKFLREGICVAFYPYFGEDERC